MYLGFFTLPRMRRGRYLVIRADAVTMLSAFGRHGARRVPAVLIKIILWPTGDGFRALTRAAAMRVLLWRLMTARAGGGMGKTSAEAGSEDVGFKIKNEGSISECGH